MKINIINKSKNSLPKYETNGSVGIDLKANLNNPIILKPFERCKIPTGLYMELPENYEAQIRPRSGISLNHGIMTILGTIDSDYRDELGIIVINLSDKEFTINNGDRIAQIIFNKIEKIEFEEVEKLNETSRKGGFGHTGLN